ncbi:hypothetical protein OUZ56_024245 [Daphnia magna]|uniref:Reverse transcriptase domain-containing protein n=1 Tax=Daphnia magna TaxID=35525 RepID=A0ABR0B0E8_9CRUS|nr:hypothetical protein OUZ56_024245 [Daphnia magna]
MSVVIAGITHHEKQQDDKIQLLEQKLTKALSEFKCTNTKRGSSQENDVTIAATDQYEKGRPRSSECNSRSRDSRLRFADNFRPSRTPTLAPLGTEGEGNPDFHLTNVPHIATNTLTGKETTTDQTLTTTGIKRVITAINIYSNNITLAKILEPLKIEK